jgi:hypothetical protein
METIHFLMSNWMPRDVLVDLALERPDILEAPGDRSGECPHSKIFRAKHHQTK